MIIGKIGNHLVIKYLQDKGEGVPGIITQFWLCLVFKCPFHRELSNLPLAPKIVFFLY